MVCDWGHGCKWVHGCKCCPAASNWLEAQEFRAPCRCCHCCNGIWKLPLLICLACGESTVQTNIEWLAVISRMFSRRPRCCWILRKGLGVFLCCEAECALLLELVMSSAEWHKFYQLLIFAAVSPCTQTSDWKRRNDCRARFFPWSQEMCWFTSTEDLTCKI